MSIGRAITTIREKAGLKQGELAKLADISPTSLSLLESNKTQGTEATLKKIADALGTDVGLIKLLAIDPEKDMSKENKEKFYTLFPNFHTRLLYDIQKFSSKNGDQ
ncbi:helix-turn-helix domain-containing protein [Niabella sp. CJ426]|uniref:helix-turn-helix domain-containing protein n=1 Tax=Niabella sp. CJ426 TaxID=3393740 RepID=UPI003D02B920